MNIAILGLGTIGSGVYELLKANSDIKVKRILAIRVWMDGMTTDINDIINYGSIELVVETMGGVEPARTYALKCLNAGKSYVSANKLLISKCAEELQAAADKSGAALMFSAACGGGIPYLYNLLKTAAADRIKKIGGILNGTTNYILDKVCGHGQSYEQALSEAQALGYAERDPSSDVDGLDTERKLMLSCAVAFSLMPDDSSIPCYGISKLSEDEKQYAKARNCAIKLLAYGAFNENGQPEAFVMPALFVMDAPESNIHLNINYAWYEGERIGRFAYSGQGAGKFPTANNIIRDIYAVLQGEKRMFPQGFKRTQANTDAKYAFYLRLPGSAAEALKPISRVLKTADGYVISETEKISFSQLKSIINGETDVFVMLLEGQI